MKVDLPNNVKIPRTTRASFLPPFPLPPFRSRRLCFRSPIDRSFFLPLHRAHEDPFCKKKKKKTCSFPSTRHMARCVFFIRGAGSPIFSLSFFLNLGFGPPLSRMDPASNVRHNPGSPDQGNEFSSFFFSCTRARSFFSLLLLLPLPLFSFLFVRRFAGRPSHTMRRKKISLKICLTVQPKLGPVLPIMGFLLAPRGQFKRAGPRIR